MPDSPWRPWPALPPFGSPPYLVTGIGHSALRHIALVPTDWDRERLVDLARRQAAANQLPTCLVLAADDAVYVAPEGDLQASPQIPRGLPVIERLRLPADIPQTDEMGDRLVRLRAFAHGQRGGYIVGDGLEAGRPARAKDLEHLDPERAGRPHPGLLPCPACGELAGEVLALRGEGNGDLAPRVVEVSCACANHNRCARCGRPLAAHRLSSYAWQSDVGWVGYLAAYAAFSHRCPTIDSTPLPYPSRGRVGARRARLAAGAPGR